MTDADVLDAAAARLASAAAAVRDALDGALAADRPDVWQGGRADRFGLELADQRRRLRAVADELRVAAQVTRARAELVRALRVLQ